MHLTFLQLVPRFPCKIRMPDVDWSDKVDQEMRALVFILEIAPLFLGFESGDKDDSLCLPKIPSIIIHSIFAYGKLKSLTNQSLNCVLNAFDFPPISAAFSLQD
nr:hypothetical protein [Tanacetum cinerariifolium]